MGLITDLLKDSPLKAEQLENIALIEKRMQDERLAATREVERLKTELDRALTELHQAQRLAKVLEHEVAEWRHQQSHAATIHCIRPPTLEVDYHDHALSSSQPSHSSTWRESEGCQQLPIHIARSAFPDFPAALHVRRYSRRDW